MNIAHWLKMAWRKLLRYLGILPWPKPPVPPVPPDPPKPPQPAPPLPRLHVEGREFVRDDGTRFDWRGVTAFRLLELIAHGRESEAVAFLDWASGNGVTVVRVLSTAVHLFDLSPEDGRAALPRLLTLANERGLYVEVVCLADTANRQFGIENHVRDIGRICFEFTNGIIETSNEPKHSTQLAGLADPATLLALSSLIPSTLLVALGAAHGSDDESDRYSGGDYVTVHTDRANGDGGWRAVRHAKEARDLSHRVGKPVVDDEPAKELDSLKWKTKGLLAKVLPLPGTFHFQSGLQAQIPTGPEMVAFHSWMAGMNSIPADWRGEFQNTGWPNSPIESADFSKVVRVYSSVSGTSAYTVLVGVTGDPKVEPEDGWRVVTKDGPLWRLAR